MSGALLRLYELARVWLHRDEIIIAFCFSSNLAWKQLVNSSREVTFSLNFVIRAQVACQVADLTVEMTKDALREVSMYLRRWASDRCASERAVRCSRTADFASWDHQTLGERPRQPNGIEALAASTKKREKERAAWWNVDCINVKRGEILKNIWLVNISMGLFVVESRGTSVGVANWREGEDNLYGEMVKAKSRESVPLAVGSERRRS